jgi:hypothetical protein
VRDITEAAKTPTPKLCGSCPKELTEGRYTVVLAMPHRDDPSTAVGMGIAKHAPQPRRPSSKKR